MASNPGSFTPHYYAEDQRKPLLHGGLLDGSLPGGYVVWNRVMLRFGELAGALSSELGGEALNVFVRDGAVVEEQIEVTFLETKGGDGKGPST